MRGGSMISYLVELALLQYEYEYLYRHSYSSVVARMYREQVVSFPLYLCPPAILWGAAPFP